MAPEPHAPSAARGRDALLVVVLAAVLVLPPVGGRLIVTSHEARFALIARDMLARGVWFDAQVRGVPYRNKPPLHPWSIAACAWWRGGVTEGAARLPGALASVATVLATFLLADRLFGGRAGLLAGLVIATSYGAFGHSQMILPDVPMIAFGMLAGYALWRAIGGTGGGPSMVVFYLMLGLGVFVKGPAGLLPLAVAVVWLWTTRGASGLRALWSPPGAAVFVGLSLLWLIPFITLKTPDPFAGRVLWSDWISYYLRAPRPAAIGGQLVDLAFGLLPWTPLAPLVLAHAVRTRAQPAVRFALLWLVVQLVLILASTSQRVRYLLVVYPAMALLTAWWATDGRRAGAARRTTVVRALALATAVAFLPGVWIYNHWINRTRNFEALAASVERHARGGEVGVFVSKGEYLQIDYYLGRDLTLLTLPPEVAAYVARAGRPVVVVNQEAWERSAGRLPADLHVLETSFVGGETMRLVRSSP